MDYHQTQAKVLSVAAEGGAYLVQLEAEEVAAAARPFQFVMVRVPGGGFPLRRPLSVFDAQEGWLEVLIRPVGAGTTRLTSLSAGDRVDITGPFGRAFEEPEGALYVAGGIGVAGVAYAVAAANRGGRRPRLFYGARSAHQLAALARLQTLADVTVVTDDGSDGEKGLVSDFVPGDARAVVACGPRPMLAALRARLSEGAAYYVVMEERMACGLGVCRSCAVPAASGDGYLAVCDQGPVLAAADVDWQRLEMDV